MLRVVPGSIPGETPSFALASPVRSTAFLVSRKEGASFSARLISSLASCSMAVINNQVEWCLSSMCARSSSHIRLRGSQIQLQEGLMIFESSIFTGPSNFRTWQKRLRVGTQAFFALFFTLPFPSPAELTSALTLPLTTPFPLPFTFFFSASTFSA